MSLLPTSAYATKEELAALQAQVDALEVEVDANNDQLKLLGSWSVQYTGASITTGFFIMTQLFGDTTPNSVQSSVMRLQPCTIKKIYLSTNGATEFSSGTMQWDLWKNAVRTGTATYSSGPRLPTLAGSNFDYLTDTQYAVWDDANIPMGEDDYFTARLTATSVVGGPEGIYMQLWGTTTS